MTEDIKYIGIPFKEGGDTPEGCDCRGLALLWLREELGFEAPAFTADGPTVLAQAEKKFDPLERGDVVFFGGPKPKHVAIYLGDDRYLHTLAGTASRIDRGLTLLRRVGLVPVGSISPKEASRLALALSDRRLGLTTSFIISLVVMIAAMAASYALRPKLPRFGNQKGRYSDSSMITQVDPEIPLPDLLGKVITAGNAVYSQLPDRAGTPGATSKWNKIVVLSSGPNEAVEVSDGLLINGISAGDPYWFNGYSVGFFANPAQTHNAADLGIIGSDSDMPSFTVYPGTHAISVPVDIRASYDRTFPLNGLAGCSYLVFRLMDATKLASFNMTCRVRGRRCRTFDGNGFVTSTASSENLPGADGTKVRFKLAFDDILAASSLTVGATSFTEMGPANQSGNVYSLNRTKGYVEFLAAPANASTITITYTYHPRAWTQNPASQIVYLLTEPKRGKGFDESKIDWASAAALRDFCDAQVSLNLSDGITTNPRSLGNYAIDSRKPIQEHVKALLDACYAFLIQSNGKFIMRARTSGSSIFSFGPANIVRETFSAELVDRCDRKNRLHVLYHGEESQNAETEVIVDDRSDQANRAARYGNDGISEENLKFPAVTDRGQAIALGQTILAEEVGGRWTCSFTTTILALALEPGDIVDVTHASYPDWSAKLFRVEELSHDDQDRLQIRASEYVAEAFS